MNSNAYRLIYKVCQAHQKELWINLENTISSVLDSFRDSLIQLTEAQCPPVDWFIAFSRGFLAYQEATRILPLIFQYLERVYLTERLGTKLQNELKTKMRRCLNTPAVLSALRAVLPHCTPRTLDPSAMHRLIVELTEYHRCKYPVHSTTALDSPRRSPRASQSGAVLGARAGSDAESRARGRSRGDTCAVDADAATVRGHVCHGHREVQLAARQTQIRRHVNMYHSAD